MNLLCDFRKEFQGGTMSLKITKFLWNPLMTQVTQRSSLTNVRKISSSPTLLSMKAKKLTHEEIGNFKALLPSLIHELTFNGIHKKMPNVNEHLAKVCYVSKYVSRNCKFVWSSLESISLHLRRAIDLCFYTSALGYNRLVARARFKRTLT